MQAQLAQPLEAATEVAAQANDAPVLPLQESAEPAPRGAMDMNAIKEAIARVEAEAKAVSYTHLTLPTIYSV